MSARWGFDGKDVASAMRHVVIPLLAGAAVAGLQAIQAGQLDLHQALTAATTALVAGGIRLLQRWTLTLEQPAGGPPQQ